MKSLVITTGIWTPPLKVPQFHAVIKITSEHRIAESVGKRSRPQTLTLRVQSIND